MFTRTLLSRRMIFLATAIALIAAGVTLSARRIEGAGEAAKPVRAIPPPAPIKPRPQSEGQGGLVRTIRVFIHPEDIYPSAVVIPPGPFRLVVENETLADVNLVVESAPPGLQHQQVANITGSRIDVSNQQDLNLDPGQYVFYEASRPDLQGRIIISQ